MVDAVANTTQTGAQTATQIAQNVTSDSGSSGVSNFDDFLTLLTAQLNNQDPLEPLDSTQFVEQLATFTGVEQQIGTNSRLDQLISEQSGASYLELGAWVGREVTASDPVFEFNGSLMSVSVPEEEGAARAQVVVRQLDGREVATISADPSGGVVNWNGVKADGSVAPAGQYRVEFVYGFGEGDQATAKTVPADGVGEVVEARRADDAIELVLANGAVVSPSAVASVRQPSAPEES